MDDRIIDSGIKEIGCFFLPKSSPPPILLKKSRRRADRHGSYVPVADLTDPAMRSLWGDIEIGGCVFQQEYIEDCAAVHYDYEKAMEGFHDSSPFLKNTVFIKHRKNKIGDDVLYSVFLVYKEREQIYIRELYRFSVMKNVSRILRDYGEEGLQKITNEHLTYLDYVFDKYKEGQVTYFAHRLRYQSTSSKKIYTRLMLTNITIP